jgi:DNA polymerase-3 subunit alpha
VFFQKSFDTFGKTRSTLLSSIDQVLDEVSNVEQNDLLLDDT